MASVFDDAMGWAVRRTQGSWSVTADLHIRYRRPVAAGYEYLVRGRVLETKGRKTKTSAELLDVDGNILAEANALFIGGIEEKLLEKLGDNNKTMEGFRS